MKMNRLVKIIFVPICMIILLPSVLHAEAKIVSAIAEFEFVKMFAGKDAEFVREKLGEPDEISSKENASGTVEFWLYKDLVRIGNGDKMYKYTQIGIINNYVETLGNTNRTPK